MQRQDKMEGFNPKVDAKYPVTNPTIATERYPANSFIPSASPLLSFPTRSIFILTVIDQARP
jgi:hypothetical protein